MENLWLLLAGVMMISSAAIGAMQFSRKPTSEQIASVKEWLVYAVTEAERELGSGTGQLKLRYVYGMFVERFPALSEFISFAMLSGLVDDALVQMRKMLETNKAVQTYVNGASILEGGDRQ